MSYTDRKHAMVGNTAMQDRTFPTLGFRFANSDNGQLYEGDGTQWLEIGMSGRPPFDDQIRRMVSRAGAGTGTTAGIGAGSGGSSAGGPVIFTPGAFPAPPTGGAPRGIDQPTVSGASGDSRSQTILGKYPNPPIAQLGVVANGNVAGSLTMPHPLGTGDLIVCVVGWRSTASPPSVPTGFTDLGFEPSADNGSCVSISYRIGQPGDTAIIQLPGTASKENTIMAIEFNGPWLAVPSFLVASAQGAGLSPSVTVGARTVSVMGAVNNNGNTPQDHDYVALTGVLIGTSQSGTGGAPCTGALVGYGLATGSMRAQSGFPGDGSLSSWGAIMASFTQ